MEKEKHIPLGEAIRHHYKTDPLRIHLASAVSDKLFAQKKKNRSDMILYIFAGMLAIIAIFFSFRFLSQFTFEPFLMLPLVLLVFYFWTSLKESYIMGNRIRKLM